MPPPSVRCSEIVDPCQRAAPDGLLDRLAKDLVQRDRGVLAQLRRIRDIEVDLDLVA